MNSDSAGIIEALRDRGVRLTPQRRAIVAEIMRGEGHIAPAEVAQRVKRKLPGINASTVYRTLDLLEEAGLVSHSHLERGAEYHRSGEGDHVHLVCASCGRRDELSLAEADRLKQLIHKHNGFAPDFTHFAISGLCARCKTKR